MFHFLTRITLLYSNLEFHLQMKFYDSLVFFYYKYQQYLYFSFKYEYYCWSFIKKKPLIGFEPMTYALPWRYSTTELKGL